jgi:hypothetical protein
MEQLSILDQSLYWSLLAKKLRFWYEPQGRVLAERHYGISESFVAWKEQGVIACLVYEYFEAELAFDKPLWRQCTRGRWVVHHEIYVAVRGWLEKRRFPAELVGCFSELVPIGRVPEGIK